MKTSDFDYNLPVELIAQTPVKRRDQSRLLVLERSSGNITHEKFYNITEHLKPGDLLVMNNSKVFPARLFGKKETTGGKVEILLNRAIRDYTWEVIGKGLKIGSRIKFSNRLSASVTNRDEQIYELFFNLNGSKFFQEIERIGQVPLPPYIKKMNDVNHQKRYQTVYAKERGSVAAPTAGMHFTPELIKEIRDKGVNIAEVTLHVGLGTFMPVKTEEVAQHRMHQEYYSLRGNLIDEIQEIRQAGGRVIAVGTTTTRVLETVFSEGNSLSPTRGETVNGFTDIYIYPPYRFKAIDALMTNFHLPKSTLLMLVSAFAGKENIDRAYKEAIKEKYRFYSYGDAMLII